MLGGVVQEIAEDLAQAVGVAGDGGELLFAVGVVDGDALGGQELVVGVDGVLQLSLDIHRFDGEGEAAVFNAGELQQLFYHAGQAPGLAGDDAHALAHVAFVAGLAAHNGLGPAGDGGEGGAQLMGDGGDKLLLHALGLLDAQGHIVDGVGKVADLVVKLLFHLDAVAAPGDAAGDAGDVFHRADDGADEVDVGQIDQDQNANGQNDGNERQDDDLAIDQAHGRDVAQDAHQLAVIQQGRGDGGDALPGLGGDAPPGGDGLGVLELVDVPGAGHGAGNGQAVGGIDDGPLRVQVLQLQAGAVLEGADVILGGGEIVAVGAVVVAAGAAEIVDGGAGLALHVGEDAAVVIVFDDEAKDDDDHRQDHDEEAHAVHEPPLADAPDAGQTGKVHLEPAGQAAQPGQQTGDAGLEFFHAALTLPTCSRSPRWW